MIMKMIFKSLGAKKTNKRRRNENRLSKLETEPQKNRNTII